MNHKYGLGSMAEQCATCGTHFVIAAQYAPRHLCPNRELTRQEREIDFHLWMAQEDHEIGDTAGADYHGAWAAHYINA